MQRKYTWAALAAVFVALISAASAVSAQTYTGRIVRVCYKPDVNALICDYRGSSAINLHVPSDIRARAGDAGPWLEFLAYMFPDEGERNRVTSARPSPKAA